MKARAFLFGLNYQNDAQAALRGCINDVVNMAAFLQGELRIPCETFTDDADRAATSALGMLNKLHEIALRTYRDDLDFVWLHYSGHGSYVRDASADEGDGRDECLVPHDYKTAGLIPDDYINLLFSYFNPKTRVVCVFDCCHSGTIGDVKYSWEGPGRVAVENILCRTAARVITLSGCLDAQTAADAYDVLMDGKSSGALTSCMLLALQEDKAARADVFRLVSAVRHKLAQRGFSQQAKLCSSYNLAKDPVLVPAP